jgi:hypothetical protein
MSGKLYDRLFLRFLFRVVGVRFFDRRKELFTPYFQYRIGPFVADYYLYFRREPSWPLYRFELFSRLNEYSGYDFKRFLDFHYDAYEDKADFLRFLRYEVHERIGRAGKRMGKYRLGLEMALTWVAEKEASVSPPDPDVDQGNMVGIMRPYMGKIKIDGRHHLERFIQLLLLVKEVSVPGRPEETLFARFSTTDLAAILQQIEELREMKVNTLQKKIGDGQRQLRRDDPRTQQLIRALSVFFYGQTDR